MTGSCALRGTRSARKGTLRKNALSTSMALAPNQVRGGMILTLLVDSKPLRPVDSGMSRKDFGTALDEFVTTKSHPRVREAVRVIRKAWAERCGSSELNILLHQHWTEAVGTAGYVKRDWKELDALLNLALHPSEGDLLIDLAEEAFSRENPPETIELPSAEFEFIHNLIVEKRRQTLLESLDPKVNNKIGFESIVFVRRTPESCTKKGTK